VLAWDALGGFGLTKTESVDLCRLAEDGYLGLRAGVMDPFAILHGRANQLVFLDCRTLDWRPVPLPAGTRALVADSGVRRRLLDSGFNDRRAECAEAVTVLRRHLPEVATLRDVTREGYELTSHHLSVEPRRRVLHVIEECERVHAGVAALERGDVKAFERLVRRSHLSSRDLYETTIPELDVLAAAAWSVEGCYGARLAGGGFGGSVNALASSEAAAAVAEAMRRAFRDRFGRQPEIFECGLGEGATLLR
jgi:galactokinase